MPNISIVRPDGRVVAGKPLVTILRQIRKGMFKEIVEAYRYQISVGNEEKANFWKERLAAFTPSGQFEGNAQADCLVKFSGIVGLNVRVEHLEDLQAAKERLLSNKHTYTCFISADGKGIIVLVKVTVEGIPDKKQVLQIETAYAQWVLEDAKVTVMRHDEVCLYSFDEVVFVNEESEIWVYQ